MATPLIRPLEERDRPAIAVLAEEVVRDGTVFPFEDVEGVLRYWSSRRAVAFVACNEGGVVGSYVIKPNQPGRGAHVANAGYMVREGQRGRGIGAALGEHSLETARALGYRAIQYNFVVTTNRSAVRLWERLGFRIVAELPGTFRHDELGYVGTYVMFREL